MLANTHTLRLVFELTNLRCGPSVIDGNSRWKINLFCRLFVYGSVLAVSDVAERLRQANAGREVKGSNAFL